MNEYERRYKDDEDEGMGLLGPLAAVAAFPAARRLSTPFGKALMENSETARAAGKALSGLSEAGSALGRDFDKMVGQSDTLSLLQTAGHMGQKRVASDLPIPGELGKLDTWKTALKQAGNDYKQLYSGVVDTARAVPHLKDAKKGVNFGKGLTLDQRVNLSNVDVAPLRETSAGTQFENLFGQDALRTAAAMAARDNISPHAAILRFMNLAEKGQGPLVKSSLDDVGGIQQLGLPSLRAQRPSKVPAERPATIPLGQDPPPKAPAQAMQTDAGPTPNGTAGVSREVVNRVNSYKKLSQIPRDSELRAIWEDVLKSAGDNVKKQRAALQAQGFSNNQANKFIKAMQSAPQKQ
jgi:hypothetical protein